MYAPFLRVYSSGSRNCFSGRNFWPGILACFSGRNFWLDFFRPEFQAEISGQNFRPEFQAEISSQKIPCQNIMNSLDFPGFWIQFKAKNHKSISTLMPRFALGKQENKIRHIFFSAWNFGLKFWPEISGRNFRLVFSRPEFQAEILAWGQKFWPGQKFRLADE